MNSAFEAMRQANPNALVAEESGTVMMIEDVSDPDGRMYRMEYHSTPDGRHASAWCRYNPWGMPPNAGEGSRSGHIFGDGSLCMGSGHMGGSVRNSPYDINSVILRARYWCTAFSVLKETGTFPQPRSDD